MVCADKTQSDAVAAKLNANSAQVALPRDRAGQTGVFRPLAQCGFARHTEPVQIETQWVVPIPDAAKRSLLTAGERALIAPRPTPTRAEAQTKDTIK